MTRSISYVIIVFQESCRNVVYVETKLLPHVYTKCSKCHTCHDYYQVQTWIGNRMVKSKRLDEKRFTWSKCVQLWLVWLHNQTIFLNWEGVYLVTSWSYLTLFLMGDFSIFLVCCQDNFNRMTVGDGSPNRDHVWANYLFSLGSPVSR